jgi:hypothetical protein
VAGANAVGLTRAIIQQQGLKGLYPGLAPAIVRHVFYTGREQGLSKSNI